MSAAKKFASQADLQEKKISFDKLSEHAYAYTAEGDPNTGIVVGDNAVMVIDTQATPVMAQDVIRRIREVTDKPIKYVVLSHYHAVRVLGASGYAPEHVIASRDTYDLIVERGAQDMKSEIERFPRLFRCGRVGAGVDVAHYRVRDAHDRVAGQAAGRDHAAGARPHQGRYSGVAAAGEDPVLRRSGGVPGHALHRGRLPDGLAGDAGRDRGARSRRSWYRGAARPCRLRPKWRRASTARAPSSPRCSNRSSAEPRPAKICAPSTRKPTRALQPKFGHWVIFDHCLPFDVSRAYDEATQYRDPRIWTAERDKEMWQALEG